MSDPAGMLCTMTQTQCTLRADVLVSQPGKRARRYPDVQCAGKAGHEHSDLPVPRQHHFLAGGMVAFGCRLENGTWVAR